MRQSSPAYKVLESVDTDKSLLGALKFLTKFNHTGTLNRYTQNLIDEVMYIQNSNEKYELPKLEKIPKTIAQIEKPNKEEGIKNLCTRFSV